MIKLSDYLNYLNNEVIQARKKADEQSIALAKEYSKHEYLKYFRVPRFSMPSVKLDIPIKIDELDSSATYNFKMDYDAFVSEVNENISKVNAEKNLQMQPITKSGLKNNGKLVELFKSLEKQDRKPVKRIEENFKKINFTKISSEFSKKSKFSTQNGVTTAINENEEFAKIINESIKNRYTPVASNLKNVFIDPNTSRETDKGKVLLNLTVEMVEEGVRIRSVKDKDGNEMEEIIID